MTGKILKGSVFAMLLAGSLAAFPAAAQDSTGWSISDPLLRPIPEPNEIINLTIEEDTTYEERVNELVNHINQIQQLIETLEQQADELRSEVAGDVIQTGEQGEQKITEVIGLLRAPLPETLPPEETFIGWKNGRWSYMSWPSEEDYFANVQD